MIEYVGWFATAAFVASYLCKDPVMLRRVQAGAACIWIVYGVALGAAPVIVANVIVAATAGWSAWRRAAS